MEVDTTTNNEVGPEPTEQRPLVYWAVIGLYALAGMFFVIALSLAFVTTYFNAPTERDYPASFTIETGVGALEVSALLEEQELVRSGTFLYLVIATLYDPTEIKASTYIIDEPVSSIELARILVEGDFGNDLIRFTHIEGQRAEQIAATAEQSLLAFDSARFLSEAIPKEGRLFPDTYFIPITYTAEELVSLLESSFETAIAPLRPAIESSELTLNQILILASIIEREANTPESMDLVSSVLQNRLEIGMPLQADASIEYILDKPLSELTPADLEIDSPYNTYVNPGLPPTPIGNPGIDSITAVLEPTETEYFYYITDDSGTFYFSETYQEHLNNIEQYLR